MALPYVRAEHDGYSVDEHDERHCAEEEQPEPGRRPSQEFKIGDISIRSSLEFKIEDERRARQEFKIEPEIRASLEFKIEDD